MERTGEDLDIIYACLKVRTPEQHHPHGTTSHDTQWLSFDRSEKTPWKYAFLPCGRLDLESAQNDESKGSFSSSSSRQELAKKLNA